MKKLFLILLGMILAPTLAWGLSSTVYRLGANYGIATSTPASTLTVAGDFAVGTNGTEFVVDSSGNLTTSGTGHDSFSDFVANEHLDWTGDLGAVNIHAGNYTDTNTTYLGGTNLTLTDTTFAVDDVFVLHAGDICTGVHDYGGATSFEIPNASAGVVNAMGEITWDSTDSQLVIYGTEERVIPTEVKIWSVAIASTSPAFIDSGLFPVPPVADGFTITHIECRVYGGTNKVIAIEDASANSTENITCLATVTDDDGSITNPTYTASEISYIDFGATSGAVNYVMISVFGKYTRE